jgi:hypothetical protein
MKVRGVVIAAVLAIAAEARAADGGGELPAPLTLPEQPGCPLRAEKFLIPLVLEISPGLPYANVGVTDWIEATLPAGSSAVAKVRLGAGGIHLSGVATPAGLPLHPARPFLVGDLIVPNSNRRLAWTTVTSEGIGLELTVEPQDKNWIIVKGPLRAVRPCADLSLHSFDEFDEFDAVGGKRDRAPVLVRPGPPAPLSARPDGPVLADLMVDRKGRDEVHVIDRQGGWARIAASRSNLLIVGWTPDARLGKPSKRKPANDGTMWGDELPGPPPPRAAVCAKGMPLVAEVGAVRRTVGSVGPGVPMLPGRPSGDLVAVTFPQSSVQPTKGARFLVRHADVRDCPWRAAPDPAAPPPTAVKTPSPAPSTPPPRCRQVEQPRCGGRAPREGEPDSTTVVVCDECTSDGDCTAEALGRCASVGGQRCAGPSRRVCRYGPPCDSRKQPCADQIPPPPPPSRPGGR